MWNCPNVGSHSSQGSFSPPGEGPSGLGGWKMRPATSSCYSRHLQEIGSAPGASFDKEVERLEMGNQPRWRWLLRVGAVAG